MPKQKKINPKKVNKIVKECLNKISVNNLTNNKNINQEYYFKDEAHYEKLLDEETKEFRKKMTPAVRKSINVIVYNGRNNDGVFSAAIAYHYLKENGKNPELIKTGPGREQGIVSKLANKVVLIVDLDIKKEVYDQMVKTAKKVIYIDEHEGDYNANTILKGKIFTSCVYTWKIFYPTKKVPLIVKYVGTSDSKKYGDFLPLSDLVVIPITFRYSRSPKWKEHQWQSGEVLEEVWELIANDNNKLFFIVGQYMKEVQENIKEQIAKNAQIRNFQGYKVGVLNFTDPVLTKRIGRQIITNMKNQGKQIDFAVLWGYEYTNNAYRVQMIDDHRQTKINMERLARVLGKKGGHPKGGGGHFHVGNFYWKHTNKQDIWDLFTKNYLTQKDRAYIEK